MSEPNKYDWHDSATFILNRNRLPPEYLEPYAGKYVAFNWEGTEIVAHGDTYQELDDMLRARGIDSSHVVYSRIPGLDEDTWL
jgi:hypothetical protein